MSEKSEGPEKSAGGCGAVFIGGLVLGALLIAGIFAWVLSRTGGSRDALDTYVASARASNHPTPTHPDPEAEETTRVVATSTDLTVRNFMVVYGTGCYSTNLATPKGDVAVEFYLEETNDVWHVAGLSTHRECHCVRSGPKASQGCTLLP